MSTQWKTGSGSFNGLSVESAQFILDIGKFCNWISFFLADGQHLSFWHTCFWLFEFKISDIWQQLSYRTKLRTTGLMALPLHIAFYPALNLFTSCRYHQNTGRYRKSCTGPWRWSATAFIQPRICLDCLLWHALWHLRYRGKVTDYPWKSGWFYDTARGRFREEDCLWGDFGLCGKIMKRRWATPPSFQIIHKIYQISIQAKEPSPL